MDNIVSRFLTFEEMLGKGLVKFAYFVLLIGLVVWAVVEIVGGIVMLFDDVGAGIWEILHTPFELALWLILLRVGTEVVLAILSIDDNLTETAIADRVRGGAANTKAFAPSAAPSVSEPVRTEPAEAGASESRTESKAPSRSSSAAAKPSNTKTTKKAAAKKTTKSAKSSPSTKATVKAASASPASARGGSEGSSADSKGGTASRGDDKDGKPT